MLKSLRININLLLTVYNLTLFDSNPNGVCFLCNEYNGMKGSCEIGAGLISHTIFLRLSITSSHVQIHAGQNRNQYISASMLYIVNIIHIDRIAMKFMKPRHIPGSWLVMHATI